MNGCYVARGTGVSTWRHDALAIRSALSLVPLVLLVVGVDVGVGVGVVDALRHFGFESIDSLYYISCRDDDDVAGSVAAAYAAGSVAADAIPSEGMHRQGTD
jgi:hypothetical protein